MKKSNSPEGSQRQVSSVDKEMYDLEIKIDQTNKLYEWKVNGASIDDAVISATATRVPNAVYVGVLGSTGNAMTIYFDNIQVRTDTYPSYITSVSDRITNTFAHVPAGKTIGIEIPAGVTSLNVAGSNPNSVLYLSKARA